MTRFLSRILDDPRRGTFNEETERLFAYHHATKHTYHSVRSRAHYLDWRNQPNPFRTYDGAPIVPLPPDPGFPKTATFAAMAALAEADKPTGNESCDGEQNSLDLDWLSRLLWHSMAVSAWKKAPRGDSRYSLRVNPSSGNLHPTETYLAVRGFTRVDDGLYHYRADRHALELRSSGAWIEKLSQALKVPWVEESNLIVGLTSIFWREAWKYRDRAYRYCCHDMGHAMMSLLLSARALGFPGSAIAHFGDASLTRVLGLAGSDEAPMAFLVFPANLSSTYVSAAPGEIFNGTPNELSEEEVPHELLLEMHRATILPDSAFSISVEWKIPDAVIPRVNEESLRAELQESRDPLSVLQNIFTRERHCPNPSRDSPLGEVVRRRRSALDFDPRTLPMERADVEQLLDFATRDWLADWRGNFGGPATERRPGVDFVTLYLYVHRVRGCEPGVYQWDRGSRSLTQLHRGNVERVAAFLSLEQSLAGNSCFTISMIADLAAAAYAFGNRGYRYVYFEAGAIGQRLYLGAEALHWNATGIGAFYDDDVHRYLGFLAEGGTPVSASLDAAEKATLVTLDSPASRHAAAQNRDPVESAAQVRSNVTEVAPRKDAKTLPQQVIYHFAVGRAIPDPRIED